MTNSPWGASTEPSFLFFFPLHKNYFTLSPEQGLRYLTTPGFSEACVREKACHCKKHKFAGSVLRPNLSQIKPLSLPGDVQQTVQKLNTDETLKNKPAEPEKY